MHRHSPCLLARFLPSSLFFSCCLLAASVLSRGSWQGAPGTFGGHLAGCACVDLVRWSCWTRHRWKRGGAAQSLGLAMGEVERACIHVHSRMVECELVREGWLLGSRIMFRCGGRCGPQPHPGPWPAAAPWQTSPALSCSVPLAHGTRSLADGSAGLSRDRPTCRVGLPPTVRVRGGGCLCGASSMHARCIRCCSGLSDRRGAASRSCCRASTASSPVACTLLQGARRERERGGGGANERT